MNICIPVLTPNGLNSEIATHFGKASTFAMMNDETEELTFFANDGTHHGGTLNPPDIIKEAGADLVLCGGLGVKAVQLFEGHGIEVYCNATGTVADALSAYKAGKLTLATDKTACQQHAH